MAMQRPGSYVVFAIFNFIVGGSLLICSPFGLAETKVEINNQDRTRDYYDFLNYEIPGYKAYTYGVGIGGLVVGVLLAVGGVGMIMAANWGRFVSIGASALGLLREVLVIFYAFVFFLPGVSKFFANTLGAPFAKLYWYMASGLAAVFALYFVMEIAMLAMAGSPKPMTAADEDDRPRRRPRDDDDYDDRPRRRPMRDDDDDRPRRRPIRDDDDRPPRRPARDDDRPRRPRNED